ncbi:Gx transporter family protein [Clostridium sp. 2218st1_F5_2218SCRN_220325]|uniref:Gx transporter family protein n=1 Tax=Clostridium sp. 2218st1_F5_2218SCRN_220325 TaxID=3143056 RepID=UPI0025F0DC60|nr:Gx transporter family protein [uncultured Intestinibacter sp.]
MKTKKMVFLGLMVGYSLILYILETYIPNPFIVFFPGAKLGLTNIITLVSLLIFGFKETFIIVTVRVILSSIFAGPMSYLLFSIGGAYLSLIVMFLVNKIKGFSVIGVSIAGAIAHNMGQLLVASILVENFLMITYLPFMLATSLVTGLFVGIVSQFCYSKMDRIKDSFINMRQ